MQEVFYEETVNDNNPKRARKKYLIFKIIGIVSYVFSAVLFFLMWFAGYDPEAPIAAQVIGIVAMFLVPSILFLIMGIYCGRVRYKFVISYDYTFVSGSVRIAKVLNQTKRKPLIKFEHNEIFQLGKVGSESFEKLSASKDIKKIVATPNDESSEGKSMYYLGISNSDGKKLIIMECTELFMVNVLKFANKTIVEKDFK